MRPAAAEGECAVLAACDRAGGRGCCGRGNRSEGGAAGGFSPYWARKMGPIMEAALDSADELTTLNPQNFDSYVPAPRANFDPITEHLRTWPIHKTYWELSPGTGVRRHNSTGRRDGQASRSGHALLGSGMPSSVALLQGRSCNRLQPAWRALHHCVWAWGWQVHVWVCGWVVRSARSRQGV